jgi:hypothetical protein
MPRRISDYPDGYTGWNLISSFGSIVSVTAVGFFLNILYKQLTVGAFAKRNPWLNLQIFTDLLQALLNRSYPSLEWGLSSPPKPHAFVSLPVQSKITTKSFSKHLTLKKFCLTVTFLLNAYILMEVILPLIMPDLFFVNYLIASCIASFINDLLKLCLGEKIFMAIGENPEDSLDKKLDGKNTTSGTKLGDNKGAVNPASQSEDTTKAVSGENKADLTEDNSDSLANHPRLEVQKAVVKDFRDNADQFVQWHKYMIGKLVKWNDHDLAKMSEDPNFQEGYLELIKAQQSWGHRHSQNKLALLRKVASYTENQKLMDKIDKLEEHLEAEQARLLEDIEKIGEKHPIQQFISKGNGFLNSSEKKINELENAVHSEIRKTLIYKRQSEFRQIINQEVPQIKKEWKEQNSYLRNKISESLKNKK